MSITYGSVVCIHNDGQNIDTWIGVVCGVHGDPADESVPVTFDVKQMGFRQVTSFSFEPKELRETVVTFEGPMCVECRRPP